MIKPNFLKESMKLNWKFQIGGGGGAFQNAIVVRFVPTDMAFQ